MLLMKVGTEAAEVLAFTNVFQAGWKKCNLPIYLSSILWKTTFALESAHVITITSALWEWGPSPNCPNGPQKPPKAPTGWGRLGASWGPGPHLPPNRPQGAPTAPPLLDTVAPPVTSYD